MIGSINPNPNRMELNKLKKRLVVAKKGYKLLKDKQEQLIRSFLDFVRRSRALRENVEISLVKAYRSFLLAKAVMGTDVIEAAIMAPTLQVELGFGEHNVMSVKIPTFHINITGDPLCYAPLGTTAELDESIKIFSEALRPMLELAEVEKAIIELANEIIKTKRRVNALQYVLIPQLEGSVKIIQSKLSEMERASIVRLMFVK